MASYLQTQRKRLRCMSDEWLRIFRHKHRHILERETEKMEYERERERCKVAMDSGGRRLLWVVLLQVFVEFTRVVKGNVVFEVQHKYGGSGKGGAALRELTAHDMRRHGRALAGLDFQLGGDGSPTSTALYFTKIAIGTPPIEYHVQVDTGSDILWINCKNCDKCPTNTQLKIKLNQYDLQSSSTGKSIACGEELCDTIFANPELRNCKVGMQCTYSVSYGDGSKSEGFFVRDNFKFDQVTGNRQTSPMNGTIAFGCSARQSGNIGPSAQAVDGIVGFGQAKSSIISQLAAAKKIKNVFSHCLSGKNGGGIFAIGEVVEPKVNKTPLVPKQVHYNIVLKGIEMGGKPVQLPASWFGMTETIRAVIDSGTTLAYLPKAIYGPLMERFLASKPDLQLHLVENQFKCFWYNKGKLDDGFPTIKFQFENSLSLVAYPHEYLFEVRNGEYCIGFQTSSMKAHDGTELILIGDILLSDKLVVYDLENQTVGWTDHKCSSSSIKIKDDGSGNVYEVRSHKIGDSSTLSANVFALVAVIVAVFALV